eukprot:TRINITY_DN17343_c0_g1_i1.p1 TRINITY_DN17343_c0_g1~~TRINITY_DN17343_c0_g1_i1.p1  ORF type:complete len:216 (-),score=24.72 TRINITY_DN17343_c0_g1_i1:42-689(-)
MATISASLHGSCRLPEQDYTAERCCRNIQGKVTFEFGRQSCRSSSGVLKARASSPAITGSEEPKWKKLAVGDDYAKQVRKRTAQGLGELRGGLSHWNAINGVRYLRRVDKTAFPGTQGQRFRWLHTRVGSNSADFAAADEGFGGEGTAENGQWLPEGWSDPTPENLIALALTAGLALAFAYIAWQLLIVFISVTLTAIKYTFIASLLIATLIFLL